jgi:hypothetical protein
MEDAAGFLTNLALGDALSGIGFGDAGESLQRVKGFQSKSLVDRSAIYNEAYADDDLSEDDDAIRAEVGDDVEAAVDSDLRVPALQRLSGEEDDYDEEVTTPMELDAVVSRADVAMDDEEPLLLPPPIDVKQLFPTFAENKVIDFTDLLSTRPRKRQKLANNPVKSEFTLALALVRILTLLQSRYRLSTKSRKPARQDIWSRNSPLSAKTETACRCPR